MKTTILFSGLVLWALAASAEARDWGFSKDTVYEWKAGGDTVGLVNNGADTLRLDSVFAEEVNSRNWHYVSLFYRGQHGYSVSQWEPSAKVFIDSVSPQSVLELYRFSVANILAKRSTEPSASAEGDTLRVRLRFKSTAGEDDTLMVVGTCCGTTDMRFTPDRPRLFKYGVFGRDILGRTVTSSARFPVLIRKILE